MATPLVAGLVAFAKAQDSNLKPSQIRSLLQASAVKVSNISTACDCRVDALGMTEMIVDKTMFVSPFATTLAPGETTQFEAVYGKAPFQFSSSNTSVATIDSSGVLTAVADGETQVTVKDATGSTATSYKIYVGKSAPPDDGGGGMPDFPGMPGDPGGGDPTQCPMQDPSMCDMLCGIAPTLPWCKQ
jgi:thermitase